jgi:hypothetical protein
MSVTPQDFRRWFTALALLGVAACGGGGGSSGGSDNPVAGIDRGGITISQGPITGFGSVFVNGVRYSTSGATVRIDGQPAIESQLRVGQVVRVSGTVDTSGTTGTARTIDYSSQVEGPVQAIDLAAGRIVVLGQAVRIGPATSFSDDVSPRGIEGLAIGDRVEVSGLVGSDGTVDATRIEKQAAGLEAEAEGVASSVDTVARRFRINQLVVDYSGAQVSNFPNGQPAEGDLVEAKGSVNAQGTLVATRIERRSASLGGSVNESAEIEGLVTRYVSAADFDVAGQRVTTVATTVYEGGSAASLALNAQVEVEGTFDASGRVVARKLQFRSEGDLEFEGRVDAVDAAAGTLTVIGRTVRTTAVTRYEDHSAADLERFGLADLRVGDYVEVRAYQGTSGLVATLVERDDAQAATEVKGPATNVSAPTLQVAGVSVTTDARTEFRDKNGASIAAATFFAAAPGREVKVRGTFVGSVLLAERAELED